RHVAAVLLRARSARHSGRSGRLSLAIELFREREDLDVARPDRTQQLDQALRAGLVAGFDALLRAGDLRALQVGSEQRGLGRRLGADHVVAGALRDPRDLRPEVAGLRVLHAFGGLGRHARLVDRAADLAELLPHAREIEP